MKICYKDLVIEIDDNQPEEEYKIIRNTWYVLWSQHIEYTNNVLYFNKDTKKILLVDYWTKKPREVDTDYRNHTITYNEYVDDENAKAIRDAIALMLTTRAASFGVVVGSKTQKHEVENARYYLVPKTLEELFDTLIRHVRYVRDYAAIYRHEHIVLHLDDIYDYILDEMDKNRFLKKKTIKGPYTDFVLTVNRPKFRREVGNKNTKTFDFIDIEMVVRSTDATKEKVKANKDEIFKKAVEKLENNKSFQKYGVPVNFLKMYQFVVRKDGTLIISFCLKGE